MANLPNHDVGTSLSLVYQYSWKLPVPDTRFIKVFLKPLNDD